MDFVEHMALVCFAGAAIGFLFLIIGGIFELINYLSKGKFETWIINIFSQWTE